MRYNWSEGDQAQALQLPGTVDVTKIPAKNLGASYTHNFGPDTFVHRAVGTSMNTVFAWQRLQGVVEALSLEDHTRIPKTRRFWRGVSETVCSIGFLIIRTPERQLLVLMFGWHDAVPAPIKQPRIRTGTAARPAATGIPRFEMPD